MYRISKIPLAYFTFSFDVEKVYMCYSTNSYTNGKKRRFFVRVLNIGIIFFSDLAQKRRCSQFSRMKRCCDPMTSMSLRPGKIVFQIVKENFAYKSIRKSCYTCSPSLPSWGILTKLRNKCWQSSWGASISKNLSINILKPS